MIDLHSHILPFTDDGSRSIEESVALLGMLAAQGVDTVAATPHFRADRETADAFLIRRHDAYTRLQPFLPASAPRILCGAEAAYYPGIGKLPALSRLCIGNSNVFLLEMPRARWSAYTVKELTDLAGIGTLTVVLAHVERYAALQTEETLRHLQACGILFQYNASYFCRFRTRRQAMALLARGAVSFIGSDCHNLTARPPQIGQAFDRIRNKLGQEFLSQFNEYGKSILGI